MSEPVVPKDEPSALQRHVAPEVPHAWLAEFSDVDEARRLREMQADMEVLDRLMWSGYSGSEWQLLSDRLIAYGFTVMFSWIRKGIVFGRCAQYGVHLRRNALCANRREAQSLAGETVSLAVVKFRQTVLVPRIWRPERGASLETYFVRQCLIRFPNIYRRWLRENGTGGADALDNVEDRRARTDPRWELIESPARYWSPGSDIACRALLDLATDPLTRSILEYVAEGYTYEEIALLLNTTESAIKSRLYRLRRAHRGSSGVIHDVA